MKRLPRKRYAQLVAQWNKGVSAWHEIVSTIEKHSSDRAFNAWRDMPEINLPYRFEPDLDAELQDAEDYVADDQDEEVDE
tara:strand:- start:248 stop:487 length:240 start_codon:yes stop_codon:yes gene_type:complete